MIFLFYLTTTQRWVYVYFMVGSCSQPAHRTGQSDGKLEIKMETVNKNVVEMLIENLKNDLKQKNLYLYRYQTNYSNFATKITYAIHDSEVRPNFSRDCSGASVELSQREGSTERCEAFRKIRKLAAMA